MNIRNIIAISFLLISASLAYGCSDAQEAAPSIAVTSIPANPVMLNGSSGAWDSIDVMNPSVFQYDGQLVDFYSGWNGSIWQTGVALSSDGGATWTKEANPILTPGNDGWSTQYIAANGSTILFNGQVLTFYQGDSAVGVTQIGLATANPLHMLSQAMYPTPVVPVGAATDPDGQLTADPFVLQVNNYLVMYYMASTPNWSFSIMQAISFDGVHWLKNETPVLIPNPASAWYTWEAGGAGEPCVFQYQGTWFMIYMGSTTTYVHSLLWATSPDGAQWTEQGLLIPQASRPAFASEIMGDPSIVPTATPGQYLLFYGGGDIAHASQGLNGRIGMMTLQVTVSGP